MDSIQSMAFQTRVWNKTKKQVFAILLRVEHVWSSIPNQHMRQPLLRRSGCWPRWPSPESDSMLLVGVKWSSIGNGMDMSMDQDLGTQDPWLPISEAIRSAAQNDTGYCTVRRKATKLWKKLSNHPMAKSASDMKSTKSLRSSTSLKSLKAAATNVAMSVKHKAAQILSPKKTKTMVPDNDDHQRHGIVKLTHN